MSFGFMAPIGLEPDLEQLKVDPLVAVDVEAAGGEPLGVSLCDSSFRSYYFSLRDAIPFLNTLRKVFHNSFYDYKILGPHAPASFDDTYIMARLLEEPRAGLKPLARTHLGQDIKEWKDLVGKGKKARKAQEVPFEEMANYSCAHALATRRLQEVLLPRLTTESLKRVYLDLELKLVPIVTQLESCGVAVDVEFFQELAQRYTSRIGSLVEAMEYWTRSRGVNFNSRKQLIRILYDELGLPIIKKTKRARNPSTELEVLEQLRDRHPIVSLLMAYREYKKLKEVATTIVQEQKDGRIHASFNPVGTATGRFSSSSPNLQNIPTRTELAKDVRKGFIAPPGHHLIKADADQIELRILAHYSQDPRLMATLCDPSGDVHEETAMIAFGSADRRREGKTLNYIIVFGGGAAKIAEITELPIQIAMEVQEKIFQGYPKIASWTEGMRREARDLGYVRTLWNRKRTLPDLGSSNKTARERALREAVNTIIQGSAAEKVKETMLRIVPLLKKLGFEARLVLQVHDELVWEVPDREMEDIVPVLKACLPDHGLSVPVTWSLSHGVNWGEMVEI